MVRLNKLECTINTANGALKEFPVPPNDDNDSGTAYPLKTVYIKAEEGKEFYIEFQAHYYVPQNEPKYDHFKLLVVLDGRAENSGTQLTRPLWWSKDSRLSRRSSASRTIKGRTNGSELRRFRFSVIQLTEELNGKGHIPDEKLDFLGEIKVLVSRFRADGTYSDRNGSPIMDPEDTVHEKNIKKILDKTLTTSYSQPETRPSKPVTNGKSLDSWKQPYAVFRFLYRSESALKDLGVIPRTPAASPVPDELMSREDLLKELKKLREEKESVRTSVKREREDEELYSQPNRQPKRKTNSKSQGGSTAPEVIVLD